MQPTDDCQSPAPAPRPAWRPLSGKEILDLLKLQQAMPLWQVGALGNEDLEAQ